MLIGICGRKQHGKDTIGAILQRQYGFQTLAFADHLKTISGDLFDLSHAQLYGDQKEDIDPRWGTTPRHILQTLGEAARTLHKDVWIQRTLRHVTSRGLWLITDCRYTNEAQAIRDHGGIILKVVRPGANTGVWEDHPSEWEVDSVVADHTILNDGSLEDLQTKVYDVMFTLANKYDVSPTIGLNRSTP